jgi:hypothetical protein
MPRWAWRVGLVLAIGLLLGRLGPFGTFGELSSAERYAYWIGLTLLMWLQGVAVLAFLDQPLARRALPRWGRVVVAALLAAIPTAFEVAWAEMLLRVERDLGPVDILAIAGDVALLSVPMLLLTHGLRPAVRIAPAPETAKDGFRTLIDMMEPKRRGSLLAVSSEDHYVRLYSDQGNQLVAMRFGDALAQLGDGNGLQVHRRWWVATDAVDSISPAGDGLELQLHNGLKVPVSRSHVQQVRKSWINRLS